MKNKTPNNILGFTIVELLVVVAIIAILAAIALPQYQLFILKSQRAEAYLATSYVRNAQTAYFSLNDNYISDCNTVLFGFACITDTPNQVNHINNKLGIWSASPSFTKFYFFRYWFNSSSNATGYSVTLFRQDADPTGFEDPFYDMIILGNNFYNIPNSPKILCDDLTNRTASDCASIAPFGFACSRCI